MNAPLLPGLEPQILPPTASPYLVDRDRILRNLEDRAEQLRRQFSVDAARIILRYLETHGPTSGEVLTDAVKAAGIVPPPPMDDRAFGPIYMKLARLGVIEKVAPAQRMKGHGTSGGNVWGLVPKKVRPSAQKVATESTDCANLSLVTSAELGSFPNGGLVHCLLRRPSSDY